MAHLNIQDPISNLASVIIVQNSSSEPEITVLNNEIGENKVHFTRLRNRNVDKLMSTGFVMGDAINVPMNPKEEIQFSNNVRTKRHLNGKNKSPALSKASISSQKVNHDIIIEDKFLKKTEECDVINQPDIKKKKIEKNVDSPKISKIQGNNKKQIFIQHDVQVNNKRCGPLLTRKRVEQSDSDQVNKNEKNIKKNEDDQKKSNNPKNNNTQIRTLQDVQLNDENHLLQSSSINNHKEYRGLENCNVGRDQAKNEKYKRENLSHEPESFSHTQICLKPEKTYQCNVCEEVFKQKSDWKLHLSKHNDINSKSEITANCQVATSLQEPISESNKSVHSDVKPFKCKTCDTCFSDKSLFTQHVTSTTHIKYECDVCEKIFYRKSDFLSHKKHHSSKTKCCPICNQEFNDESHCESHKCLKLNKKYQCDVCEEVFKQESDWKLHMSKHKNINSKIKITANCQVTTSLQDSVSKSGKSVLSDEKPFKCNTCGTCFSDKSLFTQHVTSTTHIKYECDVCEKIFYRKSDFISHKKHHSSKTKCCSICNQVFNDKSLFKSHKCLKSNKKYQCNVCEEVFKQKLDWKRHMSKHKGINSKSKITANGQVTNSLQEPVLKPNKSVLNDEKPLKCEICDTCFSDKSLFIQHVASTTHIKYECDVCEAVFHRKSNMIIHKKYHSSKTDSCTMCNQVFNNESLFKSHKCLKSNETYQCDICEEIFKQESDWKFHVSKHEDIDSKNEINANCQVSTSLQEPVLKSNESVLSVEKQFKCIICNIYFSDKSLFFDHVTSTAHIKYECDFCEEVFYQKSDLLIHMNCHSSKTESCTMCNEVFNDESLLKSHKCLQPNKKYQCNVCEEEFKQESDWKFHVSKHKDINLKNEISLGCQITTSLQKSAIESNKSVLSDEKPFKCETCDTYFSEKALFIQHAMYYIHIKYVCNFCDQEFRQESELTLHKKYHSSKIESCPICNQVFDNELLFKTHKCLKSNETYQCDICEEMFKQESDWKFHVSNHKDINLKNEITPNRQVLTSDQEPLFEFDKKLLNVEKPFKCKTCNKCFSKKSLLIWHEKSDKHIKFECNYCEKVYYQKSDFIRHIKNHLSNILVCTICNQKFKNKSLLNSHAKMKHGDVNSFTCHLCNDIIFSETDLINHLMSHVQKVPKYPILNFTSDSETESDEYLFQCQVCKMQFELKTSLRYHMKDHSEDKSYPCDVIKGHQNENLVHSNEHIKENPLKRHISKMSFAPKGNSLNHSKKLKNWTQNINKKPDPYQCDICKSFCSKKSQLIQHIKRHLKKKVYFCCVCDRKIISVFNLNYPGNKNSVKCSVCKVIF